MKKVLASREGLIGGLTAAGLTIRENSIFVALPARKALWKIVRVQWPLVNLAGGAHPVPHVCSVLAPVLDLGPWFPWGRYPDDDGYVFGADQPRAVEMRGYERINDPHHLRINGAAIDLSDGLIETLGLPPEQWGLREVEWEFVE